MSIEEFKKKAREVLRIVKPVADDLEVLDAVLSRDVLTMNT